MKKSQIDNIIVHHFDNADLKVLSDIINDFHVQTIERKLNCNELSVNQKVLVLDKVIKILRARESEGYIK